MEGVLPLLMMEKQQSDHDGRDKPSHACSNLVDDPYRSPRIFIISKFFDTS